MKIVDQSSTSTVDAAMLARGWLAVSAVSCTEDERPALDHTVCIEEYHDEGLRLIATDSYRLLVTWVPCLPAIEGDPLAEEPPSARVPHATATAVDQYGRAKSLLVHMAQMAAKDEYKGIEALVRLGVPWQTEDTPKKDLQFDGFSALAVDLEYPD